LFYPTDRSLGRRTIAQLRQSSAYPEIVRWSLGPVTYLGLNLPGSDNNFADGGKNGPDEGQAECAAATPRTCSGCVTGSPLPRSPIPRPS
jgi:hypothetical protein